MLSSTYNSLQVQLIKRLASGLQFHLNYTWSHALDESSAINNAGGQNDFIMNPANIRQDYGHAGFDQQHRMVASYSYAIPVGKGRRWSVPYLNWLVGGLNTSGIFTVASGFPFGVYSIGYYNSDQTGSSFGGRSRANVSSSPTPGFTQTDLAWFNTGVFSSAPQGTYGNSGRGILRTPYFMNLDTSFSKAFAWTERQHTSKLAPRSLIPAVTGTAPRIFPIIQLRIVRRIARLELPATAISDRWYRSTARAALTCGRHAPFRSV